MEKKYSKLLVSNCGSDSFSTIDLRRRCVCRTKNMSELITNSRISSSKRQNPLIGCHSIKSNDNSDLLYTVNSYDNSVFQLSLPNMEVKNIVYVGSYPTHIKSVKGNLLITNSDSNSISVIDEESFSLIENIQVGEKPHDIVYDDKRGIVYVANSNGYSISAIDLKTAKIGKLRLCTHPLHLSIENDTMYILSSQTNGMCCSYISVFDLLNFREIKRIPIDGVIVDMSVIKNQNVIFTSNIEDGYLYKIDINNEDNISKFFIGGMPNNIKWDGGRTLYITDIMRNLVILFDINKEKIIKRIKVGNEPVGLMLF